MSAGALCVDLGDNPGDADASPHGHLWHELAG